MSIGFGNFNGCTYLCVLNAIFKSRVRKNQKIHKNQNNPNDASLRDLVTSRHSGATPTCKVRKSKTRNTNQNEDHLGERKKERNEKEKNEKKQKKEQERARKAPGHVIKADRLFEAKAEATLFLF